MLEPWNDEAFLRRFADKIERGEGGCWVWTGANIRGRGSVKYRGKTHLAPRLAKIIHDRRWPDNGAQACHSCDNPACVRADHIWWGSNQENALDAAGKGRLHYQRRTHCAQGHPFAGANLRWSGKHRVCRQCASARQKKWRSTEGESPAAASRDANTHSQVS